MLLGQGMCDVVIQDHIAMGIIKAGFTRPFLLLKHVRSVNLKALQDVQLKLISN